MLDHRVSEIGGRARLADFLSLERNVSIGSAAVFLLGLGEELWKKLPKYLESLGASTPVIGLFGTAENFFDALYQYPGGWFADRFGRRRAFLIFVILAAAGYLIYLWSPSWPFMFLGLHSRWPGRVWPHRNICDYRRFPSARTAGNGLHDPVHTQTPSHCQDLRLLDQQNRNMRLEV